MIATFSRFIGNNLPHKCIGYDVTSCFRLAANRIRILAMSEKIMLLTCIIKATRLLFDCISPDFTALVGYIFYDHDLPALCT